MTEFRRSIRHDPPACADTAATCEIRVLDSVIDLIESYRLRYEVYGALGYLRRSNASRLEIDEFDPCAIPFGAFDLASGALIGTLRLITPEPQPVYAALVGSLIDSLVDPDLADQALAPRQRALPSIVSPEVAAAVAAFNPDGFAVQELSRTIVRPGHRGGGVSRGLMELGIAQAARSAPAVLIGSCQAEHVAMYARYGYAPLALPGPGYFSSVGQVAIAVACRTDRLPHPTLGHVEGLVRDLQSGVRERVLEIGRDSRAVFSFAESRRPRRRTLEW